MICESPIVLWQLLSIMFHQVLRSHPRQATISSKLPTYRSQCIQGSWIIDFGALLINLKLLDLNCLKMNYNNMISHVMLYIPPSINCANHFKCIHVKCSELTTKVRTCNMMMSGKSRTTPNYHPYHLEKLLSGVSQGIKIEITFLLPVWWPWKELLLSGQKEILFCILSSFHDHTDHDEGWVMKHFPIW